jgi:hypothetical protein
MLNHDLRLEVEPAGVAEVFVVRPGEAVNAPVLAAAVRVDGPVEGHIAGGRDAIDDRASVVGDQLDWDVGGRVAVALDQMTHARRGRLPFAALAVAGQSFLALPLALFAEDVEADLLEPVAGIQPRPAPPRRAAHQSVTLFGVARLHARTIPERRQHRSGNST